MRGLLRFPGLSLLLAGVALIPEALPAQDIRWPSPDTRIRITSLPGPPVGVDRSLTRLGLASAPASLVRRDDDGRVRFSASLVRAGDPFAITRTTGGNAVEFQLAELESLEAYGGSLSNWRTGLTVGALVGAAWGILFVRAVSDDPAGSDYFAVPLVLALPVGGLGALIGAVIRTDVWDPIYSR